jgi:hypothetical protein
MNALLPFYGLPIATLAERAAEAEKIVETFTLIVENGQVVLQWNDNYSRDTWWASRPRADSQINLMEPFLGLLPDFRYVQFGADNSRAVRGKEWMGEETWPQSTGQGGGETSPVGRGGGRAE